MLAWSVLALCALGAVSGRPESIATTTKRDRRDIFFKIVTGDRDLNQPVLIWPVPVQGLKKGSDSYPGLNKQDSNTNVKYSLKDVRGKTPAGYITVDPQPDQPTYSEDEFIVVVEEESEEVRPPPRRRIKYVTKKVIPKTGSRDRVPDVSFDGEVNPPNRVIENKIPINRPRPFTDNYRPIGESERFYPEEQDVQFDVDYEEVIPFSYGRGQIFETSPELIQNYLQETPFAPHLPAVMPSGRVFPARIRGRGADAPPEAAVPGPSPPRPAFPRSMRLRIDLTVPRSDFTTAYDLEWHAGSNTARTVIEDGATVFYRVPLLDGRVQYLKYEDDRLNGTKVQRCMLSPLLPASAEDRNFPGLPDLKQFHFVGYTSSEGQPQVELWRRWVIGRPGQDGAAPGESLNYTHDFFLHREGRNVVPLKYTVVTHSSLLGLNSDTYTHRYRVLPAPTIPMLPDTSKCDVMERMQEKPLPFEQRQRIASTKQFFSSSVGLGSSSAKGISLGLDTGEGGAEVEVNLNKGRVDANLGFEVGSQNPGLDSDDNPDAENSKDKLLFGDIVAAKDFFNPIGEYLGLTRPAKYDSLFDEFKEKYKRQYRDESEEAVRKAQLIKTSRFTTAGNLIANTFKMGVNYFADRLKDELRQMMEGVPPKDAPGASSSKFGYDPMLTTAYVKNILKDKLLPEKFNWKERSFNPPVHNQGPCNSCALMATTGATEGALFNVIKKNIHLSPQALIDCGQKEDGVNGCEPTFPHNAFEYIKTKGLPSLDDYKFLNGDQDTCQNKPIVTRISNYYKIRNNPDALRVVLHTRSPVVATMEGVINAPSFQSLEKGTLDDKRWCGNDAKTSEFRHAVLAVGYDFEGDKRSFTIKNSWGTGWGEGGYGDVDAKQCGILNDLSYPVLLEKDIVKNV